MIAFGFWIVLGLVTDCNDLQKKWWIGDVTEWQTGPGFALIWKIGAVSFSGVARECVKSSTVETLQSVHIEF